MDERVRTINVEQIYSNDTRSRFKVYTRHNLEKSPLIERISPQAIREIRLVSEVLPFRVNQYVLDALIDWSDYENDPIYKLTIPNRDMRTLQQYARVEKAFTQGKRELSETVDAIRRELNPHPGGQLINNIPNLDGSRIDGVQHKYNETVLYFPASGQVCHSYCTFCFRWAQFVGDKALKMEAKELSGLIAYLRCHKEVTDVLITGGDPLVMNSKKMESIIQPLLAEELNHIQTIRIGSKALTFWPQRFASDKDAYALLKIFERVTQAGKQLAIMAHFNHPREMSTSVSSRAIRLIRETGATIRSQVPVLAHINDAASVWRDLWGTQVKKGIVPYYMFVERDTGADQYFSLPLTWIYQIYTSAVRSIGGLARTVRGPVMSTEMGKVEILGVQGGHYILRFIQHRNPDLTYIPFHAVGEAEARWFDQLMPATATDKPYFETMQS
ncbi:MAG: lysine 2,3-aminomutase [Sedimenticola sp.]